MKRQVMFVFALCFALSSVAQKIKGPEFISYFQAPSGDVEYAKADVYVHHDKELEAAKLEAQKEKNAAIGAKFGKLGEQVAGAVNEGLDNMAKLQAAIDEFKDEEGRFAVWDFVPNYIIAEAKSHQAVKVEIFVLNEQNPNSLESNMPTKADKDGYYDVPYYVNCRYKVSDPGGKVILGDNLGVLKGTQKTKSYTPPPEAKPGLSVTVEESDELTATERIGVNRAYNKVRQELYARYGFGQFNSPIKLGKIKEIKESKKMLDDILAVFENKTGLLLSEGDKAKVREFVDIIEKDLDKTSDKTRWVAYHNLSVCYAWLEDAEKASAYYKKYGEEISETLEEMRKWNLFVQGKLPKEERKGLVIGMKDQKKFAEYNNIKSFVNFYPKGANRYEVLLKTINRDLARFVDFYAHNDLLCQLFEIDYPFQFLPLTSFVGSPKRMEGQLTKEGAEPIVFDVNFDRDGKIKQFEASQVIELDDGKKEKLITRKIKPQYDDNGKYTFIETNAGIWQRSGIDKARYYSALNDEYDPIADKTFGLADNITKNAGLLSEKASNEEVQLKVDLEGNIYFTGESSYFKANAIFKDLLQANNIQPKRTDTKATFDTKASINEQGVMTFWSWDGTVHTSFSATISARTQEATADRMLRQIEFLETNDKGNPTKIKYTFEMKGKMNIESKVSMKEYFNNYFETNGQIEGSMNTDNFDFRTSAEWECEFTYDEAGNWTQMKMGPYTAARTFKY